MRRCTSTPENATLRHTPAKSPRTTPDPRAGIHDEVRRLRADLADRERTIQELRQALSARDDFIATAGHELRNPMATVVMAVTNLLFLARARGDEAPPWLLARLEGLDRQARTFVRRATTLLDASRLAAGRAAIDPQPLEMGAVVEAIVRELGPEAERAGSVLESNIQGGVEGHWDRAAVETIALNLLSNAIKYGAGRPVGVSLQGTSRLAHLVVHDQGIGIAADDLPRIFERFERCTAPRSTPGFGIGLWIARELARAHGGDITVESAPGRGSIFTASLPRGIHVPQT